MNQLLMRLFEGQAWLCRLRPCQWVDNVLEGGRFCSRCGREKS